MQEADGDGFGTGACDAIGQVLGFRRVQRDERLPGGRHPLGRLECQRVLERRAYRLEEQVVAVLLDACLPAQPEEIAEARGGDESRAGAASFEDDVGGQRGAVHDAADRTRGQLRLRERRLQPAPHADERIVRRREHLDDVLGTRAVVHHHIGERAADVDTDRRRAGH